jgi:hypothetical protein
MPLSDLWQLPEPEPPLDATTKRRFQTEKARAHALLSRQRKRIETSQAAPETDIATGKAETFQSQMFTKSWRSFQLSDGILVAVGEAKFTKHNFARRSHSNVIAPSSSRGI